MHKCIIKEIEIMPDHVHIFINVLKPYKFKLTRFIHHLKGYSSFFIRKNKPWMKKYKAFWSPSYFVESIGHISSNVIRKYIRNQTVYMKKDYKYRHIVKKYLKDKLNKKSLKTKIIKDILVKGNNNEYQKKEEKEERKREICSDISVESENTKKFSTISLM